MPISAVAAAEVVLIPSSPPPTPPELRFSSSLGVPSKYFGGTKDAYRGTGNEKKVVDSFGIRDTDEESEEDLPSPTELLRGSRGREEHVQREDVESTGASGTIPVQIGPEKKITNNKVTKTSPEGGCYQDLKELVDPTTAKILTGRLWRSGKKSTYFPDNNKSKPPEVAKAKKDASSKDLVERPCVLSKHYNTEMNVETGGSETKKKKTEKRTCKSKKNYVGEGGQRKIKQAKITKPGVRKEASENDAAGIKKGSKKDNENDDSRPPTGNSVEAEMLGLDKVLPRRDKGTPTKPAATADILKINRDESYELPLLTPTTSPEQTVQVSFEKVVEAFGLPTPSSFASTSKVVTAGEGLGRSTKRRKVDLLSSINPQPKGNPVPAPKTKKGRKKYQTVTAKATEDFRPPMTTDGTSLFNYFGSSNDKNVDLGGATGAFGESTEQIKSKKSTTISRSKGSRAQQRGQTVLPPADALKGVETQNFLFGTSSQLAKEKSPTVIRDIQQAIQESESFGCASGRALPGETIPVNLHVTRALSVGFKPTASLWSAANRDSNGVPFEPPAIDLTSKTRPDSSSTKPDNIDDSLLAPDVTENMKDTSVTSDSWLAVDDIPGPMPMTSAGRQTTTAPPAQNSTTIALPSTSANPPDPLTAAPVTLPHCLAESALRPRPGPPRSKSPKKKIAKRKDAAKGMLEDPHNEPNFDECETEDLKKQIKDYGFKPMRVRKKMIELLMECWEANRRKKLGGETGVLADGQTEAQAVSVAGTTTTELAVPGNETGNDIENDKTKENNATEITAEKPKRGRKKKEPAADDGGSAKSTTAPIAKKTAKRTTKRKSQELETEAKAVGQQPCVVAGEETATIPAPNSTSTTQDQTASAPIPPPGLTSPPKSTPKRPRGRPRKTISPSTTAPSTSITTTTTTTSPTKDAPSAPPSVPLANPLPPTISSSSAAAPTPSSSTTRLLLSIHTAIQSQPPTNSVSNPSWKEKIQLYDPIVLEDLTVWLNTEGLGNVGEDEEVWPGLVREWCESKGVCCFWRGEGGWRGKSTGG